MCAEATCSKTISCLTVTRVIASTTPPMILIMFATRACPTCEKTHPFQDVHGKSLFIRRHPLGGGGGVLISH